MASCEPNLPESQTSQDTRGPEDWPSLREPPCTLAAKIGPMTRERNIVVQPTILRLGSSGRKACSSS